MRMIFFMMNQSLIFCFRKSLKNIKKHNTHFYKRSKEKKCEHTFQSNDLLN